MSLEEIKDSIAIFCADSKTRRAFVVCFRDELDEQLKIYRKKGRSVSLPEQICNVERCRRFNWRCTPCIKDFYKKKEE